ncbi:MAG: argininosuccinate synthase [candidate division WS1 bacterium]|nr:argininosuccinate synthase [candidate division WS1 bacterium]
MAEKCVLAYSGGLDTSVAIRWIADTYNVDVIAVAIDVGEERDYEGIRAKGEKVGAIESIVVDAKQEFFDEYITRAIAANLTYERKYVAFTALARPLLAQEQVRIARERGASLLAHGCTGKGNDQVRFEVTYAALAPQMRVIAPAREWNMTREEEIDYANEHNIPVPVGRKSPYSTDTNMWGRSIECGSIEDPSLEAPEDAWEWTVSPMEAPDEPRYVTIGFESGLPVSLDGEAMGGVELVGALNSIGGEHGVGRVNMMENRLVGIKSRELYECPAATIILEAHRDLESLVLDRETAHFKQHLELKWSEMIYYGLWFTPLRVALDAFMSETQKPVSGEVTVKLYKGRAEAVARKSDQSLYDFSLATYGDADVFDQSSSRGFIEIFGLPAKVVSMVRGLPE